MRHLLVILISVVMSAASSTAAAEVQVDFVHDVRPILQEHCYECHGEKKQKGNLRLDVKASALRTGPEQVIIPHQATRSALVRRLNSGNEDERMPPTGERLSRQELATLTTWIDQGAVWPDSADVAKAAEKRDWWSFRPVAAPAAGASIDSLVAAELKKQGLTMSPPADRRTLIRRLYLVLHGLPPTPEEVEAFVADRDPQAFEKLVDKLLASPRYGERWARHWLDVIAFGETDGFEVNTPRENAWPYRDYVIDAFNRDTPYPRFILEQLAGDSVGVDAATGFIVSGAALLPGQTGKDEESKLRARQDELTDMVLKTGGAFLGLTLHCARCHDHKFDPISQTDYYGIAACFAGVRHGERPLRLPTPQSQPSEQKSPAEQYAKRMHRLIAFEPFASPADDAPPRRAPVNARRNIERFTPHLARKIRFVVSATAENNRYEPCIDELEVFSTDGRNVARTAPGVSIRASGEYSGAKHKNIHINDGIYGNDRSWISNTRGSGWIEITFAKPEQIAAVIWARDRQEKYRDRMPVKYRIEIANEDGTWTAITTSADRKPYVDQPTPALMPEGLDQRQTAEWKQLAAEIEQLEREQGAKPSSPMVYAGRFEPAAKTFRLNRGDATQLREEVPPAALQQIGSPLKLATDTPEQQRRIALAKWIGDPANPLTARVLANRLWQHHFGEGLVATANDFGRNGARPTNPQLLDYLAAEFIRGGWSIKHMQRVIVTSAAWKQASTPRAECLAVDAQTKLLWRYPPRRVDAEVVRDTMLATAGTLDLKMGGPGFSVFAPNTNYVRVYDPKPEFGPAEWRRMIYVTKVRVAQDATFGAFDCPDAGQPQPVRPRSTTAIQALGLLNSGFVVQQADLLAARIKREAGAKTPDMVRRAFELAYQRRPDEQEARACAELVEQHGLPALCRVLFNTNEFLLVP